MSKFKRVQEHAQFFGVAGGFSYAFSLNVNLVRIILVCLIFSPVPIFTIYIISTLILSEWDPDPEDYESVTDS